MFPKSKVSKKNKATYTQYVVNVRLEKDNSNRVQIKASGDRLDCFGEKSTETATLETANILINSFLSTKNAKFMAMDIFNFYIQNDLEDFQYIWLHISMIPQKIIEEYNLTSMVEPDWWCYAEIIKCMYRLKEAGFLLNLKLKQILAKEDYVP